MYILMIVLILSLTLNAWALFRFIRIDGVIFVQKEEDSLVYSIDMMYDPYELQEKDRVIFKIDNLKQ